MIRALKIAGAVIALVLVTFLFTPDMPQNDLHSRARLAGTWHHLPGVVEYEDFTKKNTGDHKAAVLDPSSIEHADND